MPKFDIDTDENWLVRCSYRGIEARNLEAAINKIKKNEIAPISDSYLRTIEVEPVRVVRRKKSNHNNPVLDVS